MAWRQTEVEAVVHISTDEVYGSIDVGGFLRVIPLGPRSPTRRPRRLRPDRAQLSLHVRPAGAGDPQLNPSWDPTSFPGSSFRTSPPPDARGSNVPLSGDGTERRDWLYVAGGCVAVDLVLRRDLGRDLQHRRRQRAPNRELTDQVLALLGKGRVLG
ncbi:MAG: hypothetical protein IPH38_16540 [Candidatus Microthrix sp.]|nr:hypothetical protein [Candidatus Microthrix sp.]MBK7021144.1 hypothetical protein [Candidatus Microthrix sp.]